MDRDICVFASGEGSNFRALCEFFAGKRTPRVALLVCNRPKAGAVDIARMYGVGCHLISNDALKENPQVLIKLLKRRRVGWIVLAGFLRLLPPEIVDAFEGSIVNVHPAPLGIKGGGYGGKGMYGMRVHRRIIAAKEKESGITIHHVSKDYDKGAIIDEFYCEVGPSCTPSMLHEKTQHLAYKHYPRVVEQLITGKLSPTQSK